MTVVNSIELNFCFGVSRHYVADGGLGGGSGIFFLMAFFDQKNDGSRFLV